MNLASNTYQTASRSSSTPSVTFAACLILCLSVNGFRPLQVSARIQDSPATEQTDWPRFTPSDAGASFQMPSKPRYVERVFTPVKGRPTIKVCLHQTVVDQGNTAFLFAYNDLHETPQDRATIDKILDGAVKGSVINVGGQLLSEPNKFNYKTHFGRQFSCRYVQGEKRFIVTARLFLVGKRQYQFTFMMRESMYDERLAAKYLNSFQLVEPENDDPPVPRAKF